MTRNYSGMTYIEIGIEPDNRFEHRARQQRARRAGLDVREAQRRHGADQQFVNGPWDNARFLVVPPGSRIAASFDEGIVKVE